MRRLFFALLLLTVGLPLSAQQPVVRLTIDGAIGPATSDYVSRGIDKAAERGAALVILQMDTPGGLDSSMRDIVQAILAAPMPVVGYVHPGGARAASAGTYILYASHIAAMTPATNLGAATPVNIAPGASAPSPNPGQESDNEKAPATPDNADAKRKKAVNDAVAYIRSLAELRGRNGDWAEQAVREGVSLSAEQAKQRQVIDMLAGSPQQLLQQLDGQKVTVQGSERTLKTGGATIVDIEPDWRSRLLAVIADPNTAYILMLIGIYGLIFEFSNPGAIVPGTVGAIALILALYAFQVLPVNYAGMGLILLGLALMVGEAFAPSFGALGIGGLAAFIIGSVILIDTDQPHYGIEPGLIAGAGAVSALFLILLFKELQGLRRRQAASGTEQLLNETAEALGDFQGKGRVRAHGETWHAVSESPVSRGQQLRILSIDGLTLHVAPADDERNGGA